jgi:putative SbcD/Mre11-related phosphoesterase
MRVHSDWLLTAQRVAIHLPTRTAVAADLHLGYDQARQRRGDAVPITGVDDLLAALAALTAAHELRRLVIAGDLFEDASGRALIPELLRWLKEHGLELAGVVPGNHDRGLARGDSALPVCPDGVRLGDWLVIHGDGALPPGRLVLGHFHPCLRWGGRIAAPCYLIADERLVLPAFSPDAAGVDVLGGRRWRDSRCAVIAGADVLDFGAVSRLADRLGGKSPRLKPGVVPEV